MPLPKPRPNEKEQQFISRCIKFVIDEGTIPNTDEGRKQAAAMCYSQWRKNKRSIRAKIKTYNAELITNIDSIPRTRSNNITKREGAIAAIAMKGDQFWNNGRTRELALWSAIKKSYKTMDNRFHNLDHSESRHEDYKIRIKDIVAIHKNTTVDEENKTMIIYLHPMKDMPEYHTWDVFITNCRENNITPNVSIEAFVTVEDMKASDLPIKIDYKQYGIQDDDMVEVETDYKFLGSGTVHIGACSAEEGCGVITDETGAYMDMSCDCNTADFSTEIDYVDLDNIKFEEADKVPKKTRQEEPQPELEEKPTEEETTEEETTEEEATEGEPEEEGEEKTENAKIQAFKEKLTECGELRQQLESEKTGLEEQVIDLQNKVKGLEEKLNKPVTQQTAEEDNTRPVKERVADFFDKAK